MTDYIAVADVDAILGPGWAGSGDPGRAVMMANVWLTSKSLPELDPIPTEWKQAGAEIAREAAAGTLYATQEYGLTSKSVKADTVESSKTFASGHKIVSAGETFALALLNPWLGRGGVFMLKRI